MAYTPKTWTTGETIYAAQLNAIEQATSAASAAADTANGGLAGKADLGVGTVAAPTGVYATDVAAINAAITSAGAGGTVEFRPGTYVADGLTPLTGQAWRGNKTTIQRPTGAAANMVTATGLTGFTMTGLTLDGLRSTATASTKAAVELTSPTQCRIESCAFVNHPNTNPAIELRGPTDCVIRNNYIASVGYGILLGSQWAAALPSASNVIANNVIDGTDWNAIFLSENLGSLTGKAVVGLVKGTIVSGNAVKNAGDCGIESGTGTVGTQITGNSFVGSGVGNQGILFRDAQDCSASGNVCRDYGNPGGSGITLLPDNSICRGIVLSGNTCTGNAYNGITAQDATDVTITGGACSGNTTNGIMLDNVTGFSITGAAVIGNGQHGITLGKFQTSAATDGAITGCQIKNNSRGAAGSFSGIVLFQASTDVEITGNRIHDTQATKTQQYGIRAFDPQVIVYNAHNNVAGNLTAGIGNTGNGTVRNYRNAGWNPQGPVTITPAASPWSYGSGSNPENVYLAGGAVTSVVKNGVTFPYNAAGSTYMLEPLETLVITYTAAPTTAVSDKK